ncbi:MULTISPECIES: PIG-L deacetylase family protein [Pseudonocardiaceae]|nr:MULTISPECIES: PIG-L deacetylase family protein [Pseudonocardiaceae]PXY17515.1 GlcNAc-PI de-N-acetylase [Prauserella coralliicola]MBE1579462.1 LmbE family N-acetylglucosaminyl deacetylase [Amycolatopsis roodepoortensis]OLZ54259.1 GlcNAc-PI de-N-acetylase [Amycolatopsis keratiniphila subsp. nogabecina]PXY17808.1 GlcNAc-PI de-N-acetylase [Prauserella muralis]TKG68290.1 PIG-L family deacetylase [Prauserella endophytica]
MGQDAQARSREEQARDLLDAADTVLAVVAHPDDESFGLGAVLDHLATAGTSVTVLCFTHGEASTLGGEHADLGALRADELDAAATVLGVKRSVLLDYPDGGLTDVSVDELAGHVESLAAEVRPTYLLAFDTTGVTSHPDHVRATEAALATADHLGLPVLGWTLPAQVADQLNPEFGSPLVGSPPDLVDLTLPVSRTRHHQAIACHRSQSTDNPLLHRRLDLLGDTEHLRLLRPHRPAPRARADDH